MSNLIPTPRADRNGKIVTRHVRAITDRGSKNFPAPFSTTNEETNNQPATAPKTGNFITRWQDRRRRKQVTDALVDALFFNESEAYGNTSANSLEAALDTSPESLRTSVGSTLSTDDVELAVDVAKLVTREGIPSEAAKKDRKQILWALERNAKPERNAITVRALHAHRDWLEEHPGEALKLCHTIGTLLEFDLVGNGGRDGIDHLDEYIAAAMHLREDSRGVYAIWKKDYLQAAVRHPDQLDNIVTYINARRGFEEEGFEDYLRVASKHPDKMDRILDFMHERGDFDEGAFEQYLNTATPLSEGAL